jgi:hypothetical protein
LRGKKIQNHFIQMVNLKLKTKHERIFLVSKF